MENTESKLLHIPTHEFYDRLERTIPFDFMELKQKSSYDPSKHHRHSYYEIFFFLKGGGTHHIDFNEFEVESGSLHFVSPGQVHLLNRALNSHGYIVLFSREFYQIGLNNADTLYEFPFLNNNTSKPIIKIPENKLEYIKSLFEKIKEENIRKDEDKEEILRACLNMLLLESKRIFSDTGDKNKSSGNNKTELVKKFRILVEKNFVLMHKPGDYASMLCVTPGHLNDITQEVLGLSAGDIIHDRLILEIKRILLHTNQSVNEIAYSLNFEDPSYFTRFFKKRTGLSPKEFREKQ